MLRQQATVSVTSSAAASCAAKRMARTTRRTYKSLALTVTFKHPEFDMDDYELLSRGTAFLLGVDTPVDLDDRAFGGHLEKEELRREMKTFKKKHGYSPANPGGEMKDMSWLEFAPREHRPQVHIIASSHVLSPFLWKEYYPHEWLAHVGKEHCKYALDVLDGPGNSIASIPLDAEPFHHPEGRDVALAHFQNEKEVLGRLKKLGVEILHPRKSDDLYEKGENILFEGYAIADDGTEQPQQIPEQPEHKKEKDNDSDSEVDVRMFHPHSQTGTLAFHTNDRFFAMTPSPLPEGLCGAPAVDAKGRCCGVVEGIVPVDHENKNVAGSAAFMPHFILAPFIEVVERQMLRAMMDEDMFQMIVTAKKTNTIGGGIFKLKDDGSYSSNTTYEEATDSMIESLKKQCSKEEFDAVMNVIEQERKEISRIMKEEGTSDMGEVAQRVRRQTLAVRDMIHTQYRKHYPERQAFIPGQSVPKPTE